MGKWCENNDENDDCDIVFVCVRLHCPVLFLFFQVSRAIGAAFFLPDGVPRDHRVQENAMADVVEDMRSLGMVYCRQGANSYERAEAMYRRCVMFQICEEAMKEVQ